MTTDGPDMTPQGIADAVADLIRDLPQKAKSKPNDSWQRVLTLQVLQTVLQGTLYAEPAAREAVSEDVRALRTVAAYALRTAVEQLLRQQPALHSALMTAFEVEGWTYERPPGFASSLLGLFMASAASHVAAENEAPRTEAAATSPAPVSTPPASDPTEEQTEEWWQVGEDGQLLWVQEDDGTDDWKRS